MTDKTYKVLKEGIRQRAEGDTWIFPEIGDLIVLSPAAADHLLRDGFVEDLPTAKAVKKVKA